MIFGEILDIAAMCPNINTNTNTNMNMNINTNAKNVPISNMNVNNINRQPCYDKLKSIIEKKGKYLIS